MTRILKARSVARRIPKEVLHRWIKAAKYGGAIHTCIDCDAWTANLPLYRNDICDKKDRRKAKEDRRK